MPNKRDLYSNRDVLNAPYSGSNAGLPSDIAASIRSQITEDAKLNAQPVRIADIYPDPTQPRKVIPTTIRALWNGHTDPETMGDLFTRWWDIVNRERSTAGRAALDLVAYLAGTEQSEEDADAGPLESTLIQLALLAGSIHRDGLTNAITVWQLPDNRYSIETGERRWLAYQLLRASYPQEDAWLKIPARIVDQASRWRQAAENGARQNLNAIGKARQYAALVMDACLTAGTEQQFTSIEDCAHEHRYYAQAHDYRIPHGYRPLIMQAMGVTSTSEIVVCKTLLLLPDRVWDFADDYSIAQARLLDVADMPEANALARLQASVPGYNKNVRSSNILQPTAQALPADGASAPTADPKKSFALVMRDWKRGKPIDRSQFEQLRAFLNEIEKANKWKE